MRIAAAAVAAGAFAALACTSSARAADRAPEPPQADCETVRRYVSEHGRAASIAWAIRNGFTWAQIAAAKLCLSIKVRQ